MTTDIGPIGYTEQRSKGYTNLTNKINGHINDAAEHNQGEVEGIVFSIEDKAASVLLTLYAPREKVVKRYTMTTYNYTDLDLFKFRIGEYLNIHDIVEQNG